ncbi:MAG: T9SS type A sorting domain-containing protein [Bacteroidales bacterium]|nr:T9SS type A sorting domain-containing protein [Bacteroidales bacterium]
MMKNIMGMKLVLKCSALRFLIATLVGVMCVSFVSFGQYAIVVSGSVTKSDEGSCGNLTYATVTSNHPDWERFNVSYNGQAIDISSVSGNVLIHKNWGGDDSKKLKFTTGGTCIVVYNSVTNSVYTLGVGSEVCPELDPAEETASFTYDVNNVFYYKGATGSSSDVLNLLNWENVSGAHPSSFTADNCKYIVDVEDVVVTEKWIVSGNNTKIVVGDGENPASLKVSARIKYSNGVDVQSNAILDIACSSVPSFGKLYDNSTVKYSGNENQDVKNIRTYSNLIIEGSSRDVVFSSGDLSISGNFSAVSGINYVTTGNTVKYVSSGSQTVTAFPYNNLDLGTGNRVYTTEGTIKIAGNFIPSTGTNNVTGSTVEFNGNNQNIPASEYYNLVFNNSSQARLNGNVTVRNSLTFQKGIVTNVSNQMIEVLNTEPSAVTAMIGAFTKTPLVRHIKSNMTSSSESYLFPVGYNTSYYPLELQNITTGSGDVTVQVQYNKNGYWYVYSKGNYTEGSVSLSVPQGELGAMNSVWGSSDNSTYENLYGNISGSSVKNSNLSKFKYYKLSTRATNNVTYTYNCSGDITDPRSWSLTSGVGVPNPPVDFNVNDATWSVTCSATVPNGKVLNIGGFNSKFEVTTDNAKLFVYGSLSVDGEFALNDKATMTVYSGGKLNIYGKYSHSGSNFSKIVNKDGGVINVYTDLSLEKIGISNSGTINVLGNLTFDNRTTLTNDGTLTCTGGDVTVKAGNNGLAAPTITNSGKMVFTDCNVNFQSGDSPDSWPQFTNATGGVILVDNTKSVGKDVTFSERAVFGEGYMNGKTKKSYDFQAGSTLKIMGCDLKCTLQGSSGEIPNVIDGDIYIVDGNFIQRTAGGGGHLAFGANSTLILRDSDGNGDGILDMSGGGGGNVVSVMGTIYAEGVSYQAGGGGNQLNVESGATAFVGQLGATLEGNSYVTTINIKGGSTMYYCGNITPRGDDIGTVEAGGTLIYAQEYYEDNPITELDFATPGGAESVRVEANYTSKEECTASFKEKTGTLLPVEMTTIYGICSNNAVEIHWQTASEKDNAVFEILRSFDGINFEEIGTVLGLGNSNQVHNYEFADSDDDKTGIVYYKLKQVDFDGKTTESKIIVVQTCGKNAQFSVSDYEIVVQFKNPEETNYVIMTTISGKIVYSKTFKAVEEARIVAPKTKGIYIISVVDSKQITSEKFIR